MSAIVVEQPEARARCACCGQPAVSRVRFRGPEAQKRLKVDICRPCGKLLGRMLVGDTEDRREVKKLVS